METLDELEHIVEHGKDISMATFLRRCEITPELRKEMRRFPHDFAFFKSKTPKGKRVYYYDWSAWEHIFK